MKAQWKWTWDPVDRQGGWVLQNAPSAAIPGRHQDKDVEMGGYTRPVEGQIDLNYRAQQDEEEKKRALKIRKETAERLRAKNQRELKAKEEEERRIQRALENHRNQHRQLARNINAGARAAEGNGADPARRGKQPRTGPKGVPSSNASAASGRTYGYDNSSGAYRPVAGGATKLDNEVDAALARARGVPQFHQPTKRGATRVGAQAAAFTRRHGGAYEKRVSQLRAEVEALQAQQHFCKEDHGNAAARLLQQGREEYKAGLQWVQNWRVEAAAAGPPEAGTSTGSVLDSLDLELNKEDGQYPQQKLPYLSGHNRKFAPGKSKSDARPPASIRPLVHKGTYAAAAKLAASKAPAQIKKASEEREVAPNHKASRAASRKDITRGAPAKAEGVENRNDGVIVQHMHAASLLSLDQSQQALGQQPQFQAAERHHAGSARQAGRAVPQPTTHSMSDSLDSMAENIATDYDDDQEDFRDSVLIDSLDLDQGARQIMDSSQGDKSSSACASRSSVRPTFVSRMRRQTSELRRSAAKGAATETNNAGRMARLPEEIPKAMPAKNAWTGAAKVEREAGHHGAEVSRPWLEEQVGPPYAARKGGISKKPTMPAFPESDGNSSSDMKEFAVLESIARLDTQLEAKRTAAASRYQRGAGGYKGALLRGPGSVASEFRAPPSVASSNNSYVVRDTVSVATAPAHSRIPMHPEAANMADAYSAPGHHGLGQAHVRAQVQAHAPTGAAQYNSRLGRRRRY